MVRTATPVDVVEIEGVYRRAWRAAYEPFVEAARLDDLAAGRVRGFDWSLGIGAPGSAVLVGLDASGALRGVAQADEALGAPRDLPEVTMLYVDPVAWGTGLAPDLLRAATGWIAHRGHAAARVRMAEGHGRARRFYEREGWSPDPDLEPVATELTRLVYLRTSLD